MNSLGIEVADNLALTIEARLSTFLANKEAIAALESENEALKTEIATELGPTLDEGVRVAGMSIRRVQPVTSRLDRKKLVAQGVTIAQIEAATVSTPGKPYVRISKIEKEPEGV